jgi:hypothetical protein
MLRCRDASFRPAEEMVRPAAAMLRCREASIRHAEEMMRPAEAMLRRRGTATLADITASYVKEAVK